LAAGDDVTAVLIGADLDAVAGQLAGQGADRVLILESPAARAFSSDGWGKAIAAAARQRNPDVILGPATFRGRDLAARVAAALGVGVAQDATDISTDGDRLVATRPIFAGKAIAKVRIDSSPQIATLRPNALPAFEGTTSGTVEKIPLDDYAGAASVTATETTQSERPDVAEADVIVSGGRGMGGPEHFALVEALADELGAAVGASRAVVDAGWRPHSEQVGQTGKTVSPSLYIACGISGAVQHLAGMKTSKYIVAINKDPEAPIFQVADYGIVGDVFDVLPALTEALREYNASA
jgi:electron transfer flavoprotein alpha subunit